MKAVLNRRGHQKIKTSDLFPGIHKIYSDFNFFKIKRQNLREIKHSEKKVKILRKKQKSWEKINSEIKRSKF